VDSGSIDGGQTLDGGGGSTLPVRPSAGCGTGGAPTGALANQTTRVGGVERSYNVFVPTPYVATVPHALVFTYHGAGGSANTNQFQFDTFNTNGGARSIQVAPQGWTAPQWDTNHFVPFNLDDSVQVFDQVLESLSNTYCIDLNRVFAMGHSNGGQMAFHLGCLRGDVLRAILPSGGRCFSYGAGVCDPYHASNAQECVGDVMVLSVMGEDDTTRHADETATLEGFRVRNGCGTSTEARTPAPCARYLGCDDNAEVASCRIPGLGHSIWRAGRRDMYDYLMGL
jgi:polyhydroxybutyrate depolymerase